MLSVCGTAKAHENGEMEETSLLFTSELAHKTGLKYHLKQMESQGRLVLTQLQLQPYS